MKLEDQVCGLNYAKRLDELPVKRDSIFVWTNSEVTLRKLISDANSMKKMLLDMGEDCSDLHDFGVLYPAFTASELLDMLPDYIDDNELIIKKDRYNYHVDYQGHSKIISTAMPNLADASAMMLVQLLENNIIKAEDLK